MAIIERTFKLRVWHLVSSELVFKGTFTTKETEREMHDRLGKLFDENKYEWICEQIS